MSGLNVVLNTFFVLFLLAGVVLVPFTLPGTWLIVLTATMYAIVRDYHFAGQQMTGSSDWKVILTLLIFALAGEIVEFYTGIIGAKKYQVPNGAIVCSIIGGLIGAIVGVPVVFVGAIFGLLLGTFLGAFIYLLFTAVSPKESFKMALATLCSRVVAIFAKTVIAMAMVIFLFIHTF